MLGRHIVRLILLWVLAFAGSIHAVTPLPAGALVQHKANYFDLEHKRVRFVPSGPSAYKLTVAASNGPLARGSAIGKPSGPGSGGYGWRVRLAFPFPFGGKKWDELYVNLTGNLTFDSPESTVYPERDTWPDGTMRSVAGAIDIASIAGRQRMIAPFWGLNSAEATHIFTKSSSREFIVTWDALRYQSLNEAYTPLGRNIFQVRLARDGSIEFRYHAVAEKDGVVGVFCGPAANGKRLDHVDLPPTGAVNPLVDIRRVDVEDLGTELHFALTMAKPVPEKLAAGKLSYRAIAYSDDEGYVMNLDVDIKGSASDDYCFLVDPDKVGRPTDCSVKTLAAAKGSTVDLYLPKIGLKNPQTFYWKAEALFEDGSKAASDHLETGEVRKVGVAVPMPSGADLSTASRSGSTWGRDGGGSTGEGAGATSSDLTAAAAGTGAGSGTGRS